MIPDRWGTVPLGNRNPIDPSTPAFFLVFDALLDETQVAHRRLHSSKLWPQTELLCADLHFSTTPPLTDSEMRDYIFALLFRFVVGISDLADRNFLRIGVRVISIDEEIEDAEICFMRELRLTRCLTIRDWLKGADWETLRVHVAGWSFDDCGSAALERLATLQTKDGVVHLFGA